MSTHLQSEIHVEPIGTTPTKSWKERSKSLQVFVVEELPGIAVVVGVIAAMASRIIPAWGAVTIPALASVVAGVALRVLRVKYDMATMSDNLHASMTTMSEKLDSTVGDLLTAIVSPDVHRAQKCSRPEFYKHMLAALERAGKTVDLTQLDSHPPQHYGTPNMVVYFKRQREIVVERPHVQFRRIVAVPTLAKLEWLLDVLEATADYANFQIRVTELPRHEHLPAPLSLQIFDRQELCLVDPTIGSMLPGEQENMLWIAGKDVAEVFGNYYNDLWKRSTPLKEGRTIDRELLTSILQDLRKREQHEREQAVELGKRIRALASRGSRIPD